jgi:hypothetical protein
MIKTMYENPVKTVIFGLLFGSIVTESIAVARGEGLIRVTPSEKKSPKRKPRSRSRKK